VRLILDADAIIKLNRAGLLALLVRAYECLITQAVYDEVVTTGRAEGYVDADSIDRILENSTRVTADGEPEESLGHGEQSILLAHRSRSDVVVVTDDQRFRSVLIRRGFPELPPAGVIVLLVREGWLDLTGGFKALDAMRSLVRTSSYIEARAQLRQIGEQEP
jgi:predicted nucleic acid-binding protein